MTSRFRVLLLIAVFMVAAVTVSAALPAEQAAANLAALSIELQGRLSLVKAMPSERGGGLPAGSLENMAQWSLSARLEEALRRLEAMAADPAVLDSLLTLIENTPGTDRAVFAKLVGNLSSRQSFRVIHEPGTDAAGLRLPRLANELKTISRTSDDPRPPLGRVELMTEVRPALDLNRAPPRIGTITGGFNQQPMKLTFDRPNGTIEGGINLQPVRIRIDHEAHTIQGGANQSPVDLSFDWSPDRITLEGGVNHCPFKADIDWQSGLLTGYANNSPLRIDFDMEAGTLQGYVNHKPISLTYDKVTGVVTGGINLIPIRMTLVNLDLFDFLTHFYLFVK